MFVVYSKPNCPQCDVAKSLLKSRNIYFKEVSIDVGQVLSADHEKIAISDLKTRYPAVRSAPVIAHLTGEYVGTLSDLKSLLLNPEM
jgi:glutaredoxin